jgi:hypothetical protein
LADFAMPAFIAPNLRGESPDPHFRNGMMAFTKGDCEAALTSLTEVPADAGEQRQARFYSGVCQLHLGNLDDANTDLRAVADAGDSPEQEAALYYLAQTALAGNNLRAAHRYLLRAITLRGEMERRARKQDSKVLALIEAHREDAVTASRR